MCKYEIPLIKLQYTCLTIAKINSKFWQFSVPSLFVFL